MYLSPHCPAVAPTFRCDDRSPSELVVVESLTGDLAGQVLHVFLHLKSVRHKRDQLTLEDPQS